MKSRVPAVLALPSLLLACGNALAGPLDPPAGPPAPTFKTLGEVEPRRPVQSLPGDSTAVHTITQPGSYYLTGNITGVAGKHGIMITAENVTLDLAGFNVKGVSGSMSGIVTNVVAKGVRVHNGSVSNWPNANLGLEATGAQVVGVAASGGGLGIYAGQDAVVTNCTVANVAQYGIITLAGSSISNCTVRSAGSTGIRTGDASTVSNSTAILCNTGISVLSGSSVIASTARENTTGFSGGLASFRDCIAVQNTSNGFIFDSNCTFEGCIAQGNTGHGFNGFDGNTLTNCTAAQNTAGGAVLGKSCVVTTSTFRFNTNYGVSLGDGSTISRCTAAFNTGPGIQTTAWCTISDNSCHNNSGPSGAGIRVSNGGNRVEGNALNNNPVGVVAVVAGNYIARNTFTFNPTRIQAAPGNQVAAMIVNPGENFASTNPFANLAF